MRRWNEKHGRRQTAGAPPVVRRCAPANQLNIDFLPPSVRKCVMRSTPWRCWTVPVCASLIMGSLLAKLRLKRPTVRTSVISWINSLKMLRSTRCVCLVRLRIPIFLRSFAYRPINIFGPIWCLPKWDGCSSPARKFSIFRPSIEKSLIKSSLLTVSDRPDVCLDGAGPSLAHPISTL